MDGINETVSRADAITEIMQQHGLDWEIASALVDEVIRVEKTVNELKPFLKSGTYTNGCPILSVED